MGSRATWRARDRIQSQLEVEYPRLWDRLLLVARWFVIADNPAADLWGIKQRLADKEAVFCQLFSNTLLMHPELVYSIFVAESKPFLR